MIDAPPDPPPGPDSGEEEPVPRRRISRRNRKVLRDLHHRTWELELVVSGAILFILSQVPGRLDRVYYRLDAVLGEVGGLAAFMGYYFLKLMVYTLVVAFAFHLFTRAFWVALVGLDSVFPRGVRWDRLRQGPNARRVYRYMLPSVRELVVGTDALASVIFAAAFAIVGGLLATILSFLAFVAVLLAIGVFLPLGVDGDWLILGLALGVVLVTAGVQWVDRLFGTRLSPTGLVARSIRRFMAFSARISGLEVYGPVHFTLFSHLGSRRASLALVVVSLSLVTYFITEDLVLNRNVVEYAVTGLIPPRMGSLGVDPIYYESYRRPAVEEGHFVEPFVPTIPSETLGSEDVWLRLFVPVQPSEDPEALGRLCPDVPLPFDGGLRGRRIRGGAPPDSALSRLSQGLDCVARLWTVTLDGAPVEAEPAFMRHPDSGLTGVVRYLDTRDLAPGRHRLRVARAPEAHPPDAGDPPPTHDLLFWR